MLTSKICDEGSDYGTFEVRSQSEQLAKNEWKPVYAEKRNHQIE